MGLIDPKAPGGWSAWDYANHICAQLQVLVDNTKEDQVGDIRRVKRPFVFPTDANGNGQVILPIMPGLAIELLTYSFQMTFPAAASGYFAFYRDEEQGTGLILAATAAAILTENFNPEGHFLPENSQLLIVARGVAANTNVSGNISARNTLLGTTTARPTIGAGEF